MFMSICQIDTQYTFIGASSLRSSILQSVHYDVVAIDTADFAQSPPYHLEAVPLICLTFLHTLPSFVQKVE